MSRKLIKLQYNSPVVLTFALLSLAVLWLDGLTGGKSTHALFSVYRSSFADLGTYPRGAPLRLSASRMGRAHRRAPRQGAKQPDSRGAQRG